MNPSIQYFGVICIQRFTCLLLSASVYENWQLTKCAEKKDNKKRVVHAYQYDEDGNRIKYTKTYKCHVLESISYKYNDANQLIVRKDELAKKNKTTFYRYDKDGNLIAEFNWNHKFVRFYDYTAENHLKAVTLFIPPCKKGNKVHDALQDLTGMMPRFYVKHYAITEYVNDVNCENAEVLMELKVDGRTSAAYTYGVDRISRDRRLDSSDYLYDGRGSVTGLANTQGKVTDIYRYDAFGQLTYGMPDTTNFYGYNGEATNTNTGFQYLRARYYNPENGNFTTEDTDGGTLREPLTQNRYERRFIGIFVVPRNMSAKR